MRVALFLIVAVLFAAAYGQAPLYYSNQNQYFVHGLALAGDGLLHEDWLANTKDPTPLFSGLVAFTATFLHPWAFHVYYALLMGVYAVSLLGIFKGVVGEEIARRRWLVFAALVLLIHAAISRWASYRLFGDDYPWFLQAGVAGQYILGAMFQPSTFGVLLVAAVALFVHGRLIAAVVCSAAAATIHITYLLPAGMFTAGFIAALVAEGHTRRAGLAAALAAVLVAPITLHVLIRFGPTSATAFAEAQSILVNVRIPHHSRVDLWLDPVAGLQIAWMALAVALARPPLLRIVLGVALGLATLLTALQVVTGNDTLALLFPWRISAVLVPIATAVMLSRLIALFSSSAVNESAGLTDGAAPSRETRLQPGAVASCAVILALAGAGVWIMADRRGWHTDDEELAVMGFVRETAKPGDVYFLPVKIPKLAKTTRGSLSSDFKPLPDKQADKRVIPVNLQRFRLHAGAPIYVDFKSIPYLDVEVLEWHKRLTFAEQALQAIKENQASHAFAALHKRGVTHLVLPVNIDVRASRTYIEKIYEDSRYAVYRLHEGYRRLDDR
jgi:hypothetical protein